MGLEERTAHAGPRPDRPHAHADWRQMVGIGVVASILGIIAGLLIDWFPVAASGQAKPIDTLWDVLLIASIPVFVMVMVVVLFSRLEVPDAAGRGAAGRPADPRQHAARGDLDRDPGDPPGRPVHVRVRRARGRRAGPGRRDERSRRRRAVRVDLLLREGRQGGRVEPAAPEGRRAGQVHAPVQGRAPRLLGAGVPDEEGRGAGPGRDLPRDAEPRGRVSDRLRRAVRARALGDALERGRGQRSRTTTPGSRSSALRRRRPRPAAVAAARPTARRSSRPSRAIASPATRWPTPKPTARSGRTSTRSSPTRTRPSSASRSWIRTRRSPTAIRPTSCRRTMVRPCSRIRSMRSRRTFRK